MHATPFVLRGLLACTAVATILIGFAVPATAQSDEEGTTGALVVTEVPLGTLELGPPPPTGDLTGEGTFVGVPSGPVVVAPAPVSSSPETEVWELIEVVVPVGSTGPIPEHATIWEPIVDLRPRR